MRTVEEATCGLISSTVTGRKNKRMIEALEAGPQQGREAILVNEGIAGGGAALHHVGTLL